ncbi:MAG: hypothetical protein JWN48_5496 [Myxococcaceae bacterium]|nr:hypothetical protein [Myxococcaceae bacterium]
MSRLSVALLLLLAGCSKAGATKPAPHEHERHPAHREADEPAQPETQPESADYQPSPSEVPLTDDFTTAAQKRVTPDNYRRELVTIEKELHQLRLE